MNPNMRNIKSTTVFAWILLCACMHVYAGEAAAPRTFDSSWLEKLDAIRAPADNFRFEVRVEGPEETEMEMVVMIHDRVNSLVRYKKPEQLKEWVLLFVKDKMWLQVPEYKNPLRIWPRQRMLGGVWTADVARIVYGIDYAVGDIRRLAAVESEVLYRMRLDPISDGAAYSRIELNVQTEELLPMKSELFSVDNRKVKTVHFDDYDRVLGRQRPLVLYVVDHLEDNAETLMHFDKFEVTDTPAEWFKPSYLKHLAQLPPDTDPEELTEGE